MGLFSIVCYRLADSNLHDSTKRTIILFCRFTQNYFKDVCIPYRTAILLSYNIKQLVIYLAFITIVITIPLFEEDKMASFLRCRNISGTQGSFTKIFHHFFAAWSFF